MWDQRGISLVHNTPTCVRDTSMTEGHRMYSAPSVRPCAAIVLKLKRQGTLLKKVLVDSEKLPQSCPGSHMEVLDTMEAVLGNLLGFVCVLLVE
jgi:hypothetical protein